MGNDSENNWRCVVAPPMRMCTWVSRPHFFYCTDNQIEIATFSHGLCLCLSFHRNFYTVPSYNLTEILHINKFKYRLFFYLFFFFYCWCSWALLLMFVFLFEWLKIIFTSAPREWSVCCIDEVSFFFHSGERVGTLIKHLFNLNHFLFSDEHSTISTYLLLVAFFILPGMMWTMHVPVQKMFLFSLDRDREWCVRSNVYDGLANHNNNRIWEKKNEEWKYI